MGQLVRLRVVPRNDTRRVENPVEGGGMERAVAAMAARITRATSPTEAQTSQLAILHALLKPRASYIAEYAPHSNLLQVVTTRGRNDRRIVAVHPGEGAVGLAFSEQRVVRDPPLIAAPLLTHRSPVGCLVLVAPQKEVTDELLTALAAQVSAAIEFARVKEEALRRTKDLQTAVAGLKSLESKRETMLGSVSHDLKNPLTTIKIYLKLLEKKKLGELTEHQRKAVLACDRNADRLLRMIDDLLLHSRLQHGKMRLDQRPFGLKAAAEEVVSQLCSTAEHAQVRLVIPPCAEAYIRGDRERVREAISNLVDHSIHRSPAGATVEVAVTSSETGLAELSVTDRGPAISEQDLEHLFDSYRRVRSHSSARAGGLSLPLVAKIAQLHGGRVEVKSDPGGVWSFRLHFPLFAAAVPDADRNQVPCPGGILLVEDDADCREVVHQVLEDAGYSVTSTATASEARSLLEKIRPAMVLLDLWLSDSDGRSVLHFIRETPSLAQTAVYIITGASDIGALTGGRGKDRIEGLFEKPLRLAKLLDTVASVVHPARSPGSLGS
jgi:signal transduction histidine kinase/CheY-like chemotaxis protein